jgi:NAD-dependent deacetylase
MDRAIETLERWVRESDNIVFFGGAGVSTESGIPDFRGVDGLYAQEYDHPPEVILSRGFFMDDPGEFYRFYRNKLFRKGVEPNAAHFVLAELEKAGKLKAVITQNIDGLHHRAGSVNVLELHGTVSRNFCVDCGRPYGAEAIKGDAIPRCGCGGVIKPDVVLYGESLDTGLLTRAAGYIARADVFIVGGTSLAVYPAAGLVHYYKGHKLAIINKSATPFDGGANLLIKGSIGGALGAVWPATPPPSGASPS